LVSSLQRRVTKEGKIWAVATIEDLDASIEALFFPRTFETLGHELAADTVVAVRGRVNQRDNGTSVVAMDLAILDIADTDLDSNPPIVVVLSADKVTQHLLEELKMSLLRHRGDAPVQIRLRTRGGTRLLRAGDSYRVSASGEFVSEMKALLGPDCLHLPAR
jgi:DNA polymerase-3 subunit alpha